MQVEIKVNYYLVLKSIKKTIEYLEIEVFMTSWELALINAIPIEYPIF